MSKAAARPVGRPTKYNPQFIQEVDNYLSELNDTHLPKLVSFALRIGVNQETLTEWGKVHPEFSVALSKIMERQQEQLIDDGIYGGREVNAVIVKLLLQNNHGMRDKSDNEHTGKDGAPLSLLGGASKDGLSTNDSD